MTQLKKSLIAATVAATLALSAGSALARDGQKNGQINTERFDYIFTELNLTPEQQTDVLEVLQTTMEAQRDAMKATRDAMRDSEERPTREAMQTLRDTQREAVHQQLTDQLNTFLSPEVTEEFMTYLDAHSGGFNKGGRGHRDGGGRW